MIDKDALRKRGGSVCFILSDPDPHERMDHTVLIAPRTGDAWRVTVFDREQMGTELCHTETIHTDTTSEIELLRVALNHYRAHRPEPEPTLPGLETT